jgi:hypothetical protein
LVVVHRPLAIRARNYKTSQHATVNATILVVLPAKQESNPVCCSPVNPPGTAASGVLEACLADRTNSSQAAERVPQPAKQNSLSMTKS